MKGGGRSPPAGFMAAAALTNNKTLAWKSTTFLLFALPLSALAFCSVPQASPMLPAFSSGVGRVSNGALPTRCTSSVDACATLPCSLLLQGKRRSTRNKCARPLRSKMFSTGSEQDGDGGKQLQNGGNNLQSSSIEKVLAVVGLLDTLYITYIKSSPAPLNLCSILSSSPNSPSCAQAVFNSPFGTVAGVDVSVLGVLAYFTYLILSIVPSSPSSPPPPYLSFLKSVVRDLLFVTTTCLLVILLKLNQLCPYCIVSAICSYGIYAASATAAPKTTAAPDDNFKAKTLGKVVAGLFAGNVWYVLVGGYQDNLYKNMFAMQSPSSSPSAEAVLTAQARAAQAQAIPSSLLLSAASASSKPQSPPPITEASTVQSESILKSLKSLNSRFYGAYWCSHCYDQKQSLGSSFYKYVDYVECAPDGQGFKKNTCDVVNGKKIKGYPTWVIGGDVYEGQQTLEELQRIATDKLGVR